MEKEGITKEEAQELDEILSVDRKEDIKDVKLIKDQQQFSVKIPRDFSREMDINKDKDIFRFRLVASDNDLDKKTLQGELVKYET